jgi:hypothetical protein
MAESLWLTPCSAYLECEKKNPADYPLNVSSDNHAGFDYVWVALFMESLCAL